MFKKLIVASWLCLSSTAAFAANVAPFPSPWDPGNALGILNGWVLNTLNPGTSGLLASIATAVSAPEASSPVTVVAYTLPGGFLTNVGQAVSAFVFGSNSSDADVKTISFDFGALTVSCIVTGSANTWQVTATVVKTGPSTQQGECHGTTSTTVVASVQPSAGSVTDTAPIALSVVATLATGGTLTINGAIITASK